MPVPVCEGARRSSRIHSTSGLPWSSPAAACVCQGRNGDVSQVSAGQRVGVKQVDEHIWLITIMQYDLGYFDDDETCRLEPIENPFVPNNAGSARPAFESDPAATLHHVEKLLILGATDHKWIRGGAGHLADRRVVPRTRSARHRPIAVQPM